MWFLAAAIFTSAGPFTSVGNGYIGAWLAAAAALRAAHVSSVRARALMAALAERYERTAGAASVSSAVTVLAAASAVETVAAALACAAADAEGNGSCGGHVAYAVAVGAVSLFACLIFVALGILPVAAASGATVRRALAAFLFTWWAVAAAVLTFVAPFTVASNGYFATWAAMLASVQVVHDALGTAGQAPALPQETASGLGAKAPAPLSQDTLIGGSQGQTAPQPGADSAAEAIAGNAAAPAGAEAV
mmetsp:Transcript_14847/g.43630  ORF Transcript_14847/g.43630 Transcript_14847/m.43630 type:complete len:248 (+) Transcript_14847:3-746(+)